MTSSRIETGIDALLPVEIARKAERIGAQRRAWSSQPDRPQHLAGAFIGLGAMFATTVLAGTDGVVPFGVSRLLAGFRSVWPELDSRGLEGPSSSRATRSW